jgi:DNA helicase HerA-like ATPase
MMAYAQIGDFVRRDDHGRVHNEYVARFDIERLVESRALIQAASGFGKSSLLVEIVEATHPSIQQIIIDPEGEFSVMRKDHDFVIAAASNGDALAHPRTAGLLATRLLETKASAILDIYDVKPRERHEFVRCFIESMMNVPKDLWHPVLVFLDEAHLFCPEKGFGESEATDAVIDLAGRGRKRGFTLIAATQRIAKFNKNAAAELNNKFIGSASLDADVKRAAFELGMQPKDALTALRKLKPGEFYAFGPALEQQEPLLFKAYLPSTKLPKAGHRKLVAPPKPTD